jgi:Cof subfamily protein (haloacid dehalogenase superfamily)
MIYRMLALNIDGTLLRSNGKLTRETKEAIEYVKNKGVYVTLVTNRNFQSTNKLAKALKLNAALISHNGAFVATSIDEPIYERRIHHELVYDLIELSEKYPCQVRIVHEKYSMINRQRDHMMAKFIIGMGEPIFYPIRYVESLSEQLQEDPISPPNIDMYFPSTQDLHNFKQECEQHFTGVNILIKSDNSLVIVPEGVSKVRSLKILAKKLGIPMHQIVTVGDSYTDYEMIKEAGLGVAMGHAPTEVKEVASWVTRSNDQSGVPYMVKEVFRKQLRVQI